jgi:hypothetical protein
MAEKNRAVDLLRRRGAWQYALVIAALAYLFLWDPLRNWWVYETATAEVTAVQSLCAAFETGRPIPLQIDHCDRLKEKMAGTPGIEIKPQTFVTFSYRSPADESIQSASIVRSLDDAGRPIDIGSRIKLQLSRREPKVFRVP